jgi:transcriptional regulator GlxA family with amidase domain
MAADLPEHNPIVADAAGRIITAGGTTSWHDLALHIIARYCTRIADHPINRIDELLPWRWQPEASPQASTEKAA